MLDLKLCTDDESSYKGDLEITEDGDIQLTNSLLQSARTAILWILNEWRLGPELGFPWFDDVLVKNPNIDLIRQEIRDALLDIDGVQDADVDMVEFDPKSRRIKFRFIITTDGETYSEEVSLGG